MDLGTREQSEEGVRGRVKVMGSNSQTRDKTKDKNN
jgi:hypothetical protein